MYYSYTVSQTFSTKRKYTDRKAHTVSQKHQFPCNCFLCKQIYKFLIKTSVIKIRERSFSINTEPVIPKWLKKHNVEAGYVSLGPQK